MEDRAGSAVDSPMPVLIQRMFRRRQVNEDAKGVDRLFEFDYMGKSEFEFNTIFKSLKLMREKRVSTPDTPSTDWRIRPMMALNVTGYYFGAPETFNIGIQIFEDQLKPQEERTLDRPDCWTGIREAYFGDNRPAPKRKSKKPVYEPRRHDAWWVLDASIPFLLFKDRTHAEDWMGAF